MPDIIFEELKSYGGTEIHTVVTVDSNIGCIIYEGNGIKVSMSVDRDMYQMGKIPKEFMLGVMDAFKYFTDQLK